MNLTPWIVCFFETSVLLLVFALSLPTYIYQIVTPDEVKRVIRRNRLFISHGAVGVAAVYVSLAALFVWFADSRNQTAARLVVLQLAMIMGIGLTAVFWWYEARRHVRERVIEKLEKKIARDIDWHANVPVTLLSDLLAIGKAMERGDGRSGVLAAVERIVELAQQRSGYSGRSLQEVIKGLENMLLAGPVSNEVDEELVIGARIVRSIVVRLGKLGARNAPDAALAIRAAGRLGSVAIGWKAGAAAMAYVEIACFEPAVLAQLGQAGVEGRNYLIATACLSRLEALTAQAQALTGEEGENLMGLLSHFWCATLAKEASREQVKAVIGRLVSHERGADDVVIVLRNARRRFWLTADFETAEKIDGLVQGLSLLQAKS